jgi:hypothetical protein
VKEDQAAELVPHGPPDVKAVGKAPPDVAEKVASGAAVGVVPAFAQIWAMAPYIAEYNVSTDAKLRIQRGILTFLIRGIAAGFYAGVQVVN